MFTAHHPLPLSLLSASPPALYFLSELSVGWAGTWDIILDAEYGQQEIEVKTWQMEALDELESTLYQMDEEVLMRSEWRCERANTSRQARTCGIRYSHHA